IEARCGHRLAIERSAHAETSATAGRAARSAAARSSAGEPSIRCVLDREAALEPRAETARDAYRLRISPRGAEIRAPSLHGIGYGLQTLGQLVDGDGRLPALDVLDQPDFRDRGLMLDVSRGKVPTRETLGQLVELCARLRLNVLMLYVEHPFAFRRHPEIGAGASPLDAETILWLDAKAFDHGVELVPCLQSLGHMERLLSLERHASLAESERRWSLSPSLPETYRLLSDLYDELLPLFRSRRFNANCDEPFDLGRGRSAARAARRGRGSIFVEHVEKLRRLAARHDKRLMIWADFAHQHPDSIDALDRDVVLLDWWYEAEFDADRIGRLRSAGFEAWACPGTSSWNCLFPRIENAERNVARWADAGRRHGATGLLDTDWGDFGHYNALGVSLQGYA
ncbi:MAG TPA: glycoside hydrolase family 20 zincin-like fold domain-containing protein, partial [Myxococcota bacterium]|nr:glycoside hydrolase family 20 zincin-like fold domain-containing protein [Myxococcota bacterium]